MKISTFCLLMFFALSANGQSRFTLNGNVPQSYNNKKIYLRIYDYYSKIRINKIDSAIVKDGNFSFTGSIEKPCELANIYILNNGKMDGNVNIVIEPGVHQLIAEEVLPEDQFPRNRLSKAKILNSKANSIKHSLDSIWFKITADEKGKLDDGDRMRKILKSQLTVLSRYPDEYYSLIQMYEISRSGSMTNNLQAAMDTYKALNSEIQNSTLGKEFYTLTQEKLKISNSVMAGNLVPNFQVQTDKQILFKNSSLRGEPYIIAFSATWCIPCQRYQSTLLSLYHKYRSKGLKVVYFNLDNNINTWKNHIKNKKLDWINVSEKTSFKDSKIAKQFNAIAIPLYLIINRDGKIVYNADELKDVNYEHLEEYLKKVL